MSVDLAKPLKIETSIDGTQNNFGPTEADVTQDYITAAGFSFRGSKEFYLDFQGRATYEHFPNTFHSIVYLVNGEVDYIEYFNSSSFITANRIARVDMTYDVNLNPTIETLKIYDINGTTVLRTVTYTHTFSGVDYTSTSIVMA